MAKKNKKITPLDWLAMVLLTVGGLNWGFAVFNMNLVSMLLGQFPMVVKIIYGAVGLSAVYAIVRWIMMLN